MDEHILLDSAAGIGNFGEIPNKAEIEAAREELAGRFSIAEIEAFKEKRLAEVLRDDTGRIRGCSIPECYRPAVWERVFQKTANTHRILVDSTTPISIV